MQVNKRFWIRCRILCSYRRLEWAQLWFDHRRKYVRHDPYRVF
nr:MAG TPA: hypothetical protein [Caudoviricetes sp.]